MLDSSRVRPIQYLRPIDSLVRDQQVDAGLLNVGYVELGPIGGRVIVLLHGWPYDIHSYADAAPLLASAGYRVIVPYLRGYGTTRFLSNETVRSGQPSAVALDTIRFMDALGIDQAVIGGFDWGARTANIIAALWPERCKGMVSVSGYLIGSQASGRTPLPPSAELEWWYQYYFATERGRAGYDKYRREFAKLIWRLASPKWTFADATFDRTAGAFDNPDHVTVVVGNYRWRLGLVQGEPQYDEFEHHRREFLDSAPAVILGAAAVRTSRIRLTSAVTVLSAEDPVRAFQNFATIDLLSRCRQRTGMAADDAVKF